MRGHVAIQVYFKAFSPITTWGYLRLVTAQLGDCPQIILLIYERNLMERVTVGSVVERLPSDRVMIPGSWDQVLYQAPHREPASPSSLLPKSPPLSVSLMNK